MLRQFLFGGAVSRVNIALHALVLTMVVQVAQRARVLYKSRAHDKSHPSLFLIVVMIPTVTILMLAHTLEVIVWSLAYLLVDAAPEGSDVVYFAFVNFATLGYGDITPVARWRMLGPITAMNGVLLFGWSTAVIFEVLRRALVLGIDTLDHE